MALHGNQHAIVEHFPLPPPSVAHVLTGAPLWRFRIESGLLVQMPRSKGRDIAEETEGEHNESTDRQLRGGDARQAVEYCCSPTPGQGVGGGHGSADRQELVVALTRPPARVRKPSTSARK